MHRSNLRAAGAALIVLLVAACDDDGTTPATPDAAVDASTDMAPPDAEMPGCVDDDFEDDDDFDEAGFVELGEPIDAVLCPDDIDITAFDAEAPCPLSVVLEHEVAEGDLDLVVFDDAGERVASADSTTDDETIDVVLPAAGTYYVVVYGFEGAAADYRLTVSVDGRDGGDGRCAPLDGCSEGYDPASDCFECADGYRDGGNGLCVPLGACSRGFADGGDGECWPIGTCAPGHHPTIDQGCVATADCAGGRDNGTGVCGDDCATGFHDDGAGLCVPANTCAVGYQDGGDGVCRDLDDCAGDFTPNGSGVCMAPVDCEADADDPGDGFDTAAGLAPGQAAYGVVCPGDVDLFAVDLTSPCPTEITLRFAHDEGDLDLQWVEDLDDRNDQGEVRAEADSATDDEVAQWTGAGRYFVRVFGYNDDDSARYAVRVDSAGHDGGDGQCQPFGACSPGYALDDAGDCTACADGFRPGGDGTCVADDCTDGFHDGGDGTCVPLGRCTPGFDDDGTGACAPTGACAAGFRDGGDGTCLPEGTCADGRVDDGGACVCPDGLRDGGGGACTPPGLCADGFHDGGAGACIAEDICAAGFHRAAGLRCVATADCPDGEFDRGDGLCGDACLDDSHDGGDGICVALDACADGFHDGGDGTCVPAAGCAAGFSVDGAGVCQPELACPADDDAEPDDVWRDARTLAAGEVARGIACADDDDLFVVEPVPDCGLVARLDFAGAEADLSLVLLAGPEVGVEGAGRGPLAASLGDENRERVAIPPGTDVPVYLQVRAASDASARYRLRLDVDAARCARPVECPPETRPDGAGGCAVDCAPGYADGGDGTCLPAGQCVLGYRDGGDGSCTRVGRCAPGFTARPDGTCGPTADCPDGQTDDGIGMCSDTCFAGFADDGAGACAPVGVCAPGFADGGDGACLAQGDCIAGFAADAADQCLPDLACPADDEGEADEPRALAPGTRAFGVVCADDADRFALDVPADCLLRATLTFAHTDGDLALALTTPDGEALDIADGDGDGEAMVPGDLDGIDSIELRVAASEDADVDGTRYAIEVFCD